MPTTNTFVPCPDRNPRRQFVHRITEGECARRQARGFHKCPGCVRAIGFAPARRFAGLLAPRKSA